MRDKHLIDIFKSFKLSELVGLDRFGGLGGAIRVSGFDFSKSWPLFEMEMVRVTWFLAKFNRFFLIIATSNAVQSHVNTIPNTNKYGKEIIITNRWSANTKKGAYAKVSLF